MKFIILTLVLLPMLTHAQSEALKLQGLSITGDKELPKVLYIVPWKTHKVTKITAPIYKSSLDDDFSFINRPDISH